jgi:glycosyltransferase involved in cell wall biosynthesis
VLGSNIDGLADLIENGKNGFVVPIESPVAFQEKLARLAADPGTLHAMKSRSLEMADRFDIESIAGSFESLLKNSASPTPH